MIKEDFHYDLFSDRFLELLNKLNKNGDNNIINMLNHINLIYSYDNISLHEECKLVKGIKMMDYRVKNNAVTISYLAIGKHPEYNENGKWSRKNRQEGKVGKVILTLLRAYQPIFCYDLPDANEVELLVNKIKSYLTNDNYSFALVSGDDIKKYYLYDNYYRTDNGGYTLWGSCMRYKECQEYFNIYTDNNYCELLIMFDTTLSKDKIIARAIVWNFNGKKYVDRRYYCADVNESILVNFIKSQKWNYKKHNTYDDYQATKFYVYNDVSKCYYEQSNVLLQFPTKVYEKFPYMDTVKYLNPSEGLISNYQIGNGFRLSYTDGFWYDSHDNNDISFDDIDWDNDINSYTYDYNAPGSRICPLCGNIITEDYSSYYDNNTYCSNCVVFVSNLGQYKLINDPDIKPCYSANGILYFTKDYALSKCLEFEDVFYILPNEKWTSLLKPISDIEEYEENKFKKVNDEYILLQ